MVETANSDATSTNSSFVNQNEQQMDTINGTIASQQTDNQDKNIAENEIISEDNEEIGSVNLSVGKRSNDSVNLLYLDENQEEFGIYLLLYLWLLIKII